MPNSKGVSVIRTEKLTVMLLVLLLLPLSVNPRTTAAGESEYASLASVRKQVMNNNVELAIAALDVEIADLNLRIANAEQLRRADPIKVKLAEMELARAQQTVHVLRQELMLQTEEAYYQLVKTTRLIELAGRTKDYIDAQLKLASAQYDEGLATKEDLACIELAHVEIEHQLRNLDQERELARIKLLTLMGLPHDYALIPEDTNFEFVELAVETDFLTLLIQNNPELKHLALELELARLRQSLSHPDYTPELNRELNSLDYERQKLIYERKVGQLYLAALGLEYQIRQLEASYRQQQRQVELAKSRLNAVKLRYQEGLELPGAVTEAEIELHKVEEQLLSTVFSHNVAKAKLAHLIGLSQGGAE